MGYAAQASALFSSGTGIRSLRPEAEVKMASFSALTAFALGVDAVLRTVILLDVLGVRCARCSRCLVSDMVGGCKKFFVDFLVDAKGRARDA